MGGKAVAQGSRAGVGVGARSRLGVRSWSRRKLGIRSRSRVRSRVGVPLLPGEQGDDGDCDGVAGHQGVAAIGGC